jgi:hypothetical protein
MSCPGARNAQPIGPPNCAAPSVGLISAWASDVFTAWQSFFSSASRLLAAPPPAACACAAFAAWPPVLPPTGLAAPEPEHPAVRAVRAAASAAATVSRPE